MLESSRLPGLIFATTFLGLAASASPALARDIVKPGFACAGSPGNPGATPDNPGGIHRDPQGIRPAFPFFAFVQCFNNDGVIDVSQVRIKVADTRPDADITCTIEGRNGDDTTFGPFPGRSSGGGEQDIFIPVPFNNNTRLLEVRCRLPEDTGLGPNTLRSWTVVSRT